MTKNSQILPCKRLQATFRHTPEQEALVVFSSQAQADQNKGSVSLACFNLFHSFKLAGLFFPPDV